MRATDLDLVDAAVRGDPRVVQRRRRGRHGQDAATRRHERAGVVSRRAGLDDVNTVDRLGRLDPFDDVAGGRLVRISPDGQVVQLAGEAEGLTGPASLAFGTAEHARKALSSTNFDLFSTTPNPARGRGEVGK